MSERVLDLLLDSWDRNQKILLNLLRAVPEGGLHARATPESRTVAELFTHVHYVRLVFIAENAPDLSRSVPEQEYVDERDKDRLASLLEESARAVREAVATRVADGREMKQHYDNPVVFLQHMIWHEGYHHGQIKLALKTAGLGLADRQVGRGTWGVWMIKTRSSPT